VPPLSTRRNGLLGDCTTDATLTVPDGFTLDGNGFTITAVDPPGGHFVGAVVKNAGATAHVVDLTVTTLNLANVCDAVDDRLRGIMFQGASGSIRGNTVVNLGTSATSPGRRRSTSPATRSPASRRPASSPTVTSTP
jgi:hypothetical protein